MRLTFFTDLVGLGNLHFNLISNAGDNPVFLNWTDQYYIINNETSVPFYYDETVPTQFNDAGLLNPNYLINLISSLVIRFLCP